MSMPVSDVRQLGHADSPPAAIPGSSGGSPRRRRWWLLALGGVTVAFVVVFGVLAGTYQPLGFGGSSGGTFPGLRTGEGLRAVNNFRSISRRYLCPAAGRSICCAGEHREFRS
jgi:hypothetical protein